MRAKFTAKLTLFAGTIIIAFIAGAQPFAPFLFNFMQWRWSGPHRNGRTPGAAGISQQPKVFYISVNNGGAGKTRRDVYPSINNRNNNI
jgi:hypothetical protein